MNKLIKSYKEDKDFKLFVDICFLWLMVVVFNMIAACVYNYITGSTDTFVTLMNRWDAKRYCFMAENGYTHPDEFSGQANWAFFPMYMLVCGFIRLVTFGHVNTYIIGMTVSSVCIIIAAYYAAKLMDDDNRRMVLPVLMIAGPYSFYYMSMMTEAMFVMFVVAFFYCCKQKKYLLAGVMSALASGTRIVGCLLVFSLLIEMYIDISGERKLVDGCKHFVITMLKTPKHMLSVLLCPFCAFVYMTYLNFFCGDAWAFKSVQIAWRDTDMFPIIGVLWNACSGKLYIYDMYMGWMCILFIGMYVYMFVKKRYSLAFFGLLSLLIPLTTHTMSACRFAVGTFAVYVCLYDWLKKLDKKCMAARLTVAVLGFAYTLALLIAWYKGSAWVM